MAQDKPRSKRKLITRRWFLASASAAAVGLALDMRFIEPEWLELSEVAVSMKAGLKQPVRLLHLSDFHLSPQVSLEFIERAIRLGMEAKPQIAAITGDFVTAEILRRDEYKEVLRKLSRAVPVYACLGNHDGGSWSVKYHGGLADTRAIRELLAESGIDCLENENRSISVGGQDLTLAGLADLWAGALDSGKAFRGVAGDRHPVIVLAHNPDTKDLLGRAPWHLMLCGHTHGGQLRIPFQGATPFAPVRDHRYVAGLNPWRDRLIHTTRGVGNLYGLRFNCRPEVSVLTLQPA